MTDRSESEIVLDNQEFLQNPPRRHSVDWQWQSIAVVALVLSWTWVSVRRSGYRLIGDTAVVSLRAQDVFGPGSPVLGMPSAFSSWSTLADPAHPGPLVFWVLAPTSRFLGAADGALLGTFALAILSVIWIIRLSSRRLGRLGAPAAAIAVLAAALPGATLTGATIWEPINPTMAILPALGLCFATWSVLDGEDWTWPWLLAAASFTIQADLSYLPSSLCLVLVAAAGTGVRWKTVWASTPEARRKIRSVICWSLVVVAVLWAFPLGEAVANNGGNLLEGWRATRAGVEVRGASGAGRALILMLAPAVLLSPLLVISWKRNLPSRRLLAITAMAAAVGAAIGQAQIPVGDPGSLVWVPMAVAAVFVFFATGVLVADIAAGTGPNRPLRLGFAVWIMLLALAFSALLFLPRRNPFFSELFPAVEPLAAGVRDLPEGDYWFHPIGGPRGVALGLALTAELNSSGRELLVEEPLARYLGAERLQEGKRDGTIYVTIGSDSAPTANAKRISHWQPDERKLTAQRVLDSKVADAARTAPPVWSQSASSFFVGSIIASGREGNSETLDNESTRIIGEGALKGLDDPWKLPDAVIAQLVADGQLNLPTGFEDLQEQVTMTASDRSVSLWLGS